MRHALGADAELFQFPGGTPMTETYYAIERCEPPNGPWVDLIRFATFEEARTHVSDAERFPPGLGVRVVKVTKEVM